MKQYKGILFDLDATLIDNYASFRAAYRKLCEKFPQYFSSDDAETEEVIIGLYRKKGEEREESYRKLCEKLGWLTPLPLADFWDFWFDLYVHSALPFPWTKNVLETLQKRGIRMGLITNGKTKEQTAKIQTAGLTSYFGTILISESQGIAKPDPAIYRLGAEKIGLAVSDCLYVGDNPSVDIAGAKNASMDSLLVGKKEDICGATYRADDITVLL